LRNDVTFSDGTPLTATAVKDTFDDIVAAGAKSGSASSFVGYKDTTVVDDHTVRVDFSKPNAAFPQATTSVGLGIVSPATTQTLYDSRADGKAVVGTGPFTLASYTKNVSTVLKKRTGYAWGPASLGNSGAAHLDTVTFQIVPEASVRTGGLESQQFDAIGSVQPTDVAALTSAGLSLVDRGNPGVSFGLSFNLGHSITADIAVRQAIAEAVDKQQVRDTALNDLFNVGTSVLAKNTPGWVDESAHFGYDQAGAKKLLDDDGWTVGSDGIRTKNGQRLSLSLIWITNFGPNKTSLELIQQQLKAVGIEVTLTGSTVPEFLAAQTAGTWDIQWGNLSRADGDVLRTTFSAATSKYNIADADLENLLQAQLAAGDAAKRTAIIGQIQDRIATQYYQVPVHELTSIIGTQTAVHGVTLGADSRLDSLVGAWKASS
ncbi:ABC transporter substrate-binding protein, partial [Microbacterium sp. Leaf351]